METSAAELVVLQPDSAHDAARLAQLATHWHDGLSAAQLAERERLLRTGDAWTRGSGNLTLFALLSPAAEGAQKEVLASCEVWRMQAACRDTEPADGALRSGVVFGVASVFTPQHHRGKGFASELLRRVRTRLGAETCFGMHLMCEVKPDIYARLGFVAPFAEARDWEFTASEPGFDIHSPGVRFLLPADVPEVRSSARALPARYVATQLLSAQAAAELEKRVRASLSAGQPGAVAVLPQAEQLLWPRSRDAARRSLLSLPDAPAACGASCGRSLALWAFDTDDHGAAGLGEAGSAPVLRILAFAPADDGHDDADAAVLAAAVQTALAGGAARVLLWSTDAITPRTYAHDAQPYAPPEEELLLMGVHVEDVPRACKSLPMLARSDGAGVQPAQWRYIPRGVWI